MKHTSPNILLITANDLGRHLGCYGISTVHSPNIDRLANDGVRFDNAFAPSSECAPSWAALFTGRYPHCTGVMGRSQPHFAWQLGAGEKHLAQLLLSAGYRTALVGSNDVGAGAIARSDSFVDPSFQPDHQVGSTRCGFDEAVPPGPGESIAEMAAKWLETNGRDDRPFYLQIGFREAHRQASIGLDGADRIGFLGDYMAPDDALGVTVPPFARDTPLAREELAELQGAIRYLDEQVGRVLDALRLLDLEKETLVVFTTDHGLAVPRAKATLLDSGLETALIFRWPTRGWKGGRVVSEPVSSIALLPTVLETAGLPVDDGVHGASFLGLLDGQTAGSPEPLFAEMNYHDYYDPIRCVRSASHKLVVYFSNGRTYADPSESWAPRMTAARAPEPSAEGFHPLYELYDLERDPHEWRNVVDDPAKQNVLTDLLAELHDWMHETNDPLLAGAVTSPFHRWAVETLVTAGHPEKRSGGGK